uniref:Uncharacterized protein n=1 Tax=Schistocephalus solidus TaxID=70667 RepID=A0A0V0J9Z9_SCHSO
MRSSSKRSILWSTRLPTDCALYIQWKVLKKNSKTQTGHTISGYVAKPAADIVLNPVAPLAEIAAQLVTGASTLIKGPTLIYSSLPTCYGPLPKDALILNLLGYKPRLDQRLELLKCFSA